MAINTIDGALAGMQQPRFFMKALGGTMVAGRPHSYWSINGNPGPGSFSTTIAGNTMSSNTTAIVAGQIPRFDPASGNAYLARFVGYSTIAGTLVLADRLWNNGGMSITSTSAQTINSVTWPARDNNGSSNGEGVLIGVEVSATTGTGTPTLTISYTNSNGTSGKSGANTVATAASSVTGTFYPIGLAAGDTGVRSIQSYTQSATWTSGTVNLVAYRILATLECPAAYVPNAIDVLTGGMPRLYNGTVPFIFFIPATTTTSYIGGSYTETWG